jgi:5-methylcytosine-specific restriction endonuclease McrA
MDNLVTACYRCNSSKANWTLEELGWGARPFLKKTSARGVRSARGTARFPKPVPQKQSMLQKRQK